MSDDGWSWTGPWNSAGVTLAATTPAGPSFLLISNMYIFQVVFAQGASSLQTIFQLSTEKGLALFVTGDRTELLQRADQNTLKSSIDASDSHKVIPFE